MDDFIPRRGPADTLTDRLRAYVEGHDRPPVLGWRGADEELLTEYARLAGFGTVAALPSAYRSYARGLGLDDGGLFTDFRYEMRLDTVVHLYRDCLRTEPDTLNPELPICGMTELGDQLSFDRRPAHRHLLHAPARQGIVSSDGDRPQPQLPTPGAVQGGAARRPSGGAAPGPA